MKIGTKVSFAFKNKTVFGIVTDWNEDRKMAIVFCEGTGRHYKYENELEEEPKYSKVREAIKDAWMLLCEIPASERDLELEQLLWDAYARSKAVINK